ncbi:metal-dependent hydrolase [Rhizobium miluonense]|uniref:L-ascorbate metabolism protein UlaG, beta-lactamase superfamily n=1 Tax=Rhizobium miluonense TaxID=411945 RepID=A0A1C3X0F9_9HYPH|nr:metal-dependent hydrolase [Rhizobium miluonense]SCB45616.1 L-ascorbate metabolism protein UlaG, beta-lactamase superfamily [Rhizobium miluonense]
MTRASFTRMRFLGVAAYEVITREGLRVLLDPFLTGNPASPARAEDFDQVDLIIVTHAAMDHLGDTAVIARRTGAPVICGGEVKAFLTGQGIPTTQVRTSAWGMRLSVAGIEVQTVECRHCSHMTMPDGTFISGIPLSYVIMLDDNVRLYHPGDTSLFSDMKLLAELYRPTIGSIGIANPDGVSSPGPGEKLTSDLSPEEGVLASQWLGLRTVLPCHYTNPENHQVTAFVEAIDQARTRGETVPEAIVMRPGEWLEIDHDGTARRAPVSSF